MVLTLKQSYDYVLREMDFPRVKALTEYLSKSPNEAQSLNKISMMISAYFGIEDKPDIKQLNGDNLDDDEDNLLADLDALNS